MRWAAIAVTALLLAAGCGSDGGPAEGYVRAREYQPKRVETYQYQTCVSYDPKTYTCTLYMPQTGRRTVGASWRLLLETCTDGECVEGWRSVSEDEYARYAVGQHYPEPR